MLTSRVAKAATAGFALSALIATSGLAAPAPSSASDAASPRPQFRVPEQEPAGVLPNESVIADFTDDGNNDVAVVSYADRGLMVFPGKGRRPTR